MSKSCCPPQRDQTTAEPPSCCSSKPADASCCPPTVDRERPGYRLQAYVSDWLQTPIGEIPQVATTLTASDRRGALQMRWGMGRDHYTVAPGLYAVGHPQAEAPVLVSANYKLSFDALRKELREIDAWILVIDTKGINVWCAAGKGTFGTAEITRRVKSANLSKVVNHRRLILPQLGAPGVAAHKVAAGCGFKIVYGPVRARDLPAFLQAECKATAAMRRVSFTTWERLILTPVELMMMTKVSAWILLGLVLLGGIGPAVFSLHGIWSRGLVAAAVYLAGLVAGAVVTPVLLPWVPGTALALKGCLVGLATALIPCGIFVNQLGMLHSFALILALSAVASYCAMNFTGSTTYTSPSGVGKEMRVAIPLQALAVLLAGISWFWGTFSTRL